VDAEATEALEKIQSAVELDRIEMTSHFDQRIAERGLLWVDVLVIVDEPTKMEFQGEDDHGWPKWRIWLGQSSR
jgi:hypothetical protein